MYSFCKMSQKDQQRPSNLPWKVNLLVNAFSFAVDMCRRADGSVNRRLMNFIDPKTPPSPTPLNGVKSTDITIDKARDLWFRLYTPTLDTTTLPVIIFFHGGGYALFSAASIGYDEFCRRLARELSAFVVSVNYRLAPEHRFPAQIEDGFDALTFIDTAEIEGFSGKADLKRCFLAGDSAGGNLVHHVAVKAGGSEFSRVKLAGNIMIQPFFGGEERTEFELRLTRAIFISTEFTDWMWKVVLPERANRDHLLANVFGPDSGDISGIEFPATVVVVGGFDPLKDWQKRYYEGLKKEGKEAYLVEYENAFHPFYAVPELPESALLIKEVKAFMHK